MMPNGLPWPRISIVTATFNQVPFVEATIRSILLQGYLDLEYFIIDGGSTDGSVEIIRKYEPWLTYWVSEPDRGQSHAINKGFARCTGQILNWINSDDRLLPVALLAIATAAAEYPAAPAFVGSGRVVDAGGNLLGIDRPKGLRRQDFADWAKNGIQQPACFFRKDILDQFGGGVDEDLFICFDVDLWLRLSRAGDFVSVGQIIAEITLHPDAKTQRSSGLTFIELIAVQARHGFMQKAIAAGMQLLNDYEELARKVRRATGSFPYRFLRPVIKVFFH
jgi:glycosyltransferase involved in cell wall biosynthesis